MVYRSPFLFLSFWFSLLFIVFVLPSEFFEQQRANNFLSLVDYSLSSLVLVEVLLTMWDSVLFPDSGELNCVRIVFLSASLIILMENLSLSLLHVPKVLFEQEQDKIQGLAKHPLSLSTRSNRFTVMGIVINSPYIKFFPFSCRIYDESNKNLDLSFFPLFIFIFKAITHKFIIYKRGIILYFNNLMTQRETLN